METWTGCSKMGKEVGLDQQQMRYIPLSQVLEREHTRTSLVFYMA